MLSEIERERVTGLMEIANSINIDHVAIYHANKYGLDSDIVLSWVPELKKWLVLCASNRKNDYILFGNVDKLWHTFMLFSVDYHNFCSSLGVDYIHHVPSSSANGPARAEGTAVKLPVPPKVAESFSQLLSDVSDAFGDIEDTLPVPAWPAIDLSDVDNPLIVIAIPEGAMTDPTGGGGGTGCGCGEPGPQRP